MSNLALKSACKEKIFELFHAANNLNAEHQQECLVYVYDKGTNTLRQYQSSPSFNFDKIDKNARRLSFNVD